MAGEELKDKNPVIDKDHPVVIQPESESQLEARGPSKITTNMTLVVDSRIAM